MAEPWFKDGLHFTCTQCGDCCAGFPGYVWVDDAEIAALAEFLGEPLETVRAVYTRKVGSRRSLREKANDDCVFWERGTGCTVYSARPKQCRTWPFWESNMKNEATWQRTAEGCPGCNHGELIPSEEILKRIATVRV